MYLRWSDGYSHAVELHCNEQSLVGKLFAAVQQFKMDTGLLPTQLHVHINGKWWNPGRIKSVDGIQYFEATPVVLFPVNEGENLENINIWLLSQRRKIIDMVLDTHKWMGALTNMTLDTAQELNENYE